MTCSANRPTAQCSATCRPRRRFPRSRPGINRSCSQSIVSGKASNVDATTAQQLEDLFNAYRACSAVDPYHSVFGFFSTDFYVRLKSVQEYWGEPDQPWAIWMAASFIYLKLDTGTLQALPDGRIGGLINSPTTNVYVWFVQENGQWKIDEYHPNRAGPNHADNRRAGALHEPGGHPTRLTPVLPLPKSGEGRGEGRCREPTFTVRDALIPSSILALETVRADP